MSEYSCRSEGRMEIEKGEGVYVYVSNVKHAHVCIYMLSFSDVGGFAETTISNIDAT